MVSLEDILENQGAILGRQEQIMLTQHETIFYVVFATFGMIVLVGVLMYMIYSQLIKRLEAIHGIAITLQKSTEFSEKINKLEDVEKNTLVITESMKIITSTLQLIAMNFMEIKDDLKTVRVRTESDSRILPVIEENYRVINEILAKVKFQTETLPALQASIAIIPPILEDIKKKSEILPDVKTKVDLIPVILPIVEILNETLPTLQASIAIIPPILDDIKTHTESITTVQNKVDLIPVILPIIEKIKDDTVRIKEVLITKPMTEVNK